MYTPEQKKAYFAGLRERWNAAKLASENDHEAHAIYMASGVQASYTSFYFALIDMRAAGYDGIPYVDMLTVHKWRDNGYMVNKGEHSKVHGVVWMRTKDKEGNEDPEGALYPKQYALFHRSQVSAIS